MGRRKKYVWWKYDKKNKRMKIKFTATKTTVQTSKSSCKLCICLLYRVAPKNGTVDTVSFSGLCSDQQLSFFTLLDRASFPHYNNTKIIKFGWELFILCVISYELSFSGFARFPEFRGTINDSFSSKYMRQAAFNQQQRNLSANDVPGL